MLNYFLIKLFIWIEGFRHFVTIRGVPIKWLDEFKCLRLMIENNITKLTLRAFNPNINYMGHSILRVHKNVQTCNLPSDHWMTPCDRKLVKGHDLAYILQFISSKLLSVEKNNLRHFWRKSFEEFRKTNVYYTSAKYTYLKF